ncbi:type II secretion system protein [Candidatus Saccharibacteria bacterium]|nr:type II secretion system protein [Candidatus Saccharibacteria bacterium]
MRRYRQLGFSIVELLIVMIVLGVLALIVTAIVRDAQQRALVARRNSDLTVLYKAILAARASTGKTLVGITGRGWSEGGCSNVAPWGQNQSNIEPKNLPKSHNCWLDYYQALNDVGTAAGTSLVQLRDGDINGNPYLFDENEGEHAATNCQQDELFYYNGDGTANRTVWKMIPNSLPECL